MSSATVSPLILPQIEDLSRLVGERIGLDFPRRKWGMLQRVVEELTSELNFAGPQPFLDQLLYSPLSESHLNLLIARLTIGETYFLRDKNVFTVLRDHVFPALIKQRASERRLDLWCAASATGEEPYSIAMLLDEKAASLENWQINISASDINLEVLEKAKKGVYSRWSLRATPEEMCNRYFSKIGENQFLLSRHIREMVSFYQLNLAEKEFVMPGFTGRSADIIFCRNVLIYFSSELQARVIRRLVSLLQPGGWLLVAPSELGAVNDLKLSPVRFPGVFVFQKIDKSSLTEIITGPASASVGTSKKLSVPARPRPWTRRCYKKLQPVVSPGKGSPNSNKVDLSLKEIRLRVEELFHHECYREVLELIPDLVNPSPQEVPEYAQVMAIKARSLANLGELEGAAMAADLAVKADKINSFFYYLSASIARERANYEAAVAFYRQAIFLDADFVMAHFSLATLLRQMGRKGADRHLQNVIILLELLEDAAADVVLPHAEGLSAGRLLEIVRNLTGGVE